MCVPIAPSITAMMIMAPPDADIARVDLRQTALQTPLESLTMWLVPSRQPGTPRGELILAWAGIALATDWSVK
jgi:hypothetical protein